MRKSNEYADLQRQEELVRWVNDAESQAGEDSSNEIFLTDGELGFARPRFCRPSIRPVVPGKLALIVPALIDSGRGVGSPEKSVVAPSDQNCVDAPRFHTNDQIALLSEIVGAGARYLTRALGIATQTNDTQLISAHNYAHNCMLDVLETRDEKTLMEFCGALAAVTKYLKSVS